jgi:hypothetical protein
LNVHNTRKVSGACSFPQRCVFKPIKSLSLSVSRACIQSKSGGISSDSSLLFTRHSICTYPSLGPSVDRVLSGSGLRTPMNDAEDPLAAWALRPLSSSCPSPSLVPLLISNGSSMLTPIIQLHSPGLFAVPVWIRSLYFSAADTTRSLTSPCLNNVQSTTSACTPKILACLLPPQPAFGVLSHRQLVDCFRRSLLRF